MSRLLIIVLIIILIPVVLLGGAMLLLSNPEVYRDRLNRTFAEQTGLEIDIGGDMSWRYFPPIALTLGNVAVRPPGADTALASLGEAEVDVALWPLVFGGELAINGLTIDNVEINAIVDEEGNANWETEQLTGAETEDPAAAPGRSLTLDIEQIRLSNIVINYRDRQAGGDYTIIFPSMTTGRVVYGEPAPVQFELMLTDNDAGMTMEATGDGDITLAEGFSPIGFDELQLDQTLTLPEMQPITSSLSLNGQYDTAAGKLEASIKGTLAGSDIEGTTSVATGDVLDVDFAFALGMLDLDTILPPEAEGAEAGSAAAAEDVEVLPLETLRGMNIDGDLSVASLHYGDYDFTDLKLDIVNADNELTATATMQGYDGTLNVRFTGTTGGSGAGQTSVQLQGVDIQQLTGAEAITGHVNLNSNTTFTGNMLSDVLGTLDGLTQFDITDGTMDVRPIKRLAVIVDALRGEASGVGTWPDRMPFEQLTGQHRFIHGAASDQQFGFDLKVLEADGTGGFDYLAGTIGYDITLSFNETEGEFSVGPGLARLDWPLRCRGEFGQSVADLCFAEEGAIRRMLQDVARQEIERQGEEKLREKIQEKLPEELRESAEGLLRGLLRRD